MITDVKIGSVICKAMYNVYYLSLRFMLIICYNSTAIMYITLISVGAEVIKICLVTYNTPIIDLILEYRYTALE